MILLTLGNITSVNNSLSYEDICKPTKPWRKLFTSKLSAVEAKDLCKKMNGKHSVVSNAEESQEYTSFITDVLETNEVVNEGCNYINEGSQYGPSFILAQHKEIGPLETNPVKNPYNGDVITFIDWYNGWPNGNFLDKGSYWMVFKYNDGNSKYIHQINSQPFCFTCDGVGSVLPIVRMRGLCQTSQFDKNYIIAQNSEDVLFYQGDRHTNISFDQDNNRWVMVSNRKIEKGMEEDLPVFGFSKVLKIKRCFPIESSIFRTLLMVYSLAKVNLCLKRMSDAPRMSILRYQLL